MAVKIKLNRRGKIREPYYRIIVADARTKRDGRAIEEIGKYHPKADPSVIEVNSDRAQHWLSVGAQPTDPVRKLLEVTGDWQRFKGLPGAEGTLKTAQTRTDKKEVFAAALAETLAESGATTAKGRGRSGGAKTGDAKASDAKASDAKADRPARAAKADAGKGDAGRAGAAKSKAAKADAAEAAQPEAAQPEAAKPEAAEPKVAEPEVAEAAASAEGTGETTAATASDEAAAEAAGAEADGDSGEPGSGD